MEHTGYFTDIFLSAVTPQISVIVGSIILMLLAVFNQTKTRTLILNGVTLGALVVSIIFSCNLLSQDTAVSAFNGMLRSNTYSLYFNILFSAIGIAVTLIAPRYLQNRSIAVPEFYSLLLFSVSGMMVMTSANDLIVFFIGLEILSLPLYVMAALDHNYRPSLESGFKYFIMGGFSAAIQLFGIAFVFGATGSTSLDTLYSFIGANGAFGSYYLAFGLLLFIFGIGFKISMAPFHMWTPDVYQGAPVVVTALMSTGPKAAAFTFFIKIVYPFVIHQSSIDPGQIELTQTILSILAFLTMVGGNFLAMQQTDLKRLMAASSIAHVGYLIIAMASMNKAGLESGVLYFTFYIVMNTGFFALLITLASEKDENLTLDGIAGLAKKSPLTGLLMVILVFSLAGIPPLAGFTAKFSVFMAAIEANLVTLAIIGILNSALSAYYYLKILVYAYMKEGDESEINGFKSNIAGYSGAMVLSVAVIFLGVYPQKLVNLATEAIRSLQ